MSQNLLLGMIRGLESLNDTLSTPPTLWCNNIGALALASNPVYHAHIRHIEMDFMRKSSLLMINWLMLDNVSVFLCYVTSSRWLYPLLACGGLLRDSDLAHPPIP